MPKKKVAKKKKKFPLTKKISEIDHLDTLIKYSIRAVTGRNGVVDDYFIAQALKLEEQKQKLKRNQ